VPISKIAHKYLVLYLGNRVYNGDEPVFRRIYGAGQRAIRSGSIGRKFHPQEHDLFDAVDDEYRKRFDRVFGAEG